MPYLHSCLCALSSELAPSHSDACIRTYAFAQYTLPPPEAPKHHVALAEMTISSNCRFSFIIPLRCLFGKISGVTVCKHEMMIVSACSLHLAHINLALCPGLEVISLMGPSSTSERFCKKFWMHDKGTLLLMTRKCVAIDEVNQQLKVVVDPWIDVCCA